jgi:hypothetical protein
MAEMTEGTSVAAPSEDTEGLKAEVERLKAENESLKAKPGGGGSRTAWGIVLAVIAALLFAIAVPAVWVNRVVMDPARGSPRSLLGIGCAIQDAVATLASDRLIEALDAQTRLESISSRAAAARAGHRFGVGMCLQRPAWCAPTVRQPGPGLNRTGHQASSLPDGLA